MITCARCSKDNQDHYKFCLGCGGKLERAATGTSPVAGGSDSLATAPTHPPVARTSTPVASIVLARGTAAKIAESPAAARPSGFRASGGYTPPPPANPVYASPAVEAPATAPRAAAAAPVTAAPAADACPQCGNKIASHNTFCGKCGFRLKAGAQAAAAVEAPVARPTAAPAAVPRTMYMAAPQNVAPPRGHLTLIRPDGTEGGTHPLVDGENLIGRGQGSLFDADPYLSPRHAEFTLDDNGLTIEDLRSLNGVFIKVTEEEALDSGSIFRIGQELLRFDVISQPAPLEDGTEIIGTPNPGYWGRISVIVGRDVDGPAFPIFEESIVLGRERGDILFPEDGYVSATHARISLRDGHDYLQDLGSSNGTFIRATSARTVVPGSLILMGQQLFRIQYR